MEAEESATRLREIAAQAMDPCVTSSAVVAAFWEDMSGGEIDAQAGYEAVRERVLDVRDGGLSGAEATLVGQATALNVIFAEMARRGYAALNRPGNAAERYLRLAMRAQTQCRMTLRALRELADRPSREKEETDRVPKYTVVRRVIVSPRYDENGGVIPRTPAEDAEIGAVDGIEEDYADWAARNARREPYGGA